MTTLSGTVEHITFHNPENGFAVLRVEVAGKRDLVTIIGHVPGIQAGETVEAIGDWVNDRDYGQQFKAEQIKILPPHTQEGIVRFLGSGAIKGVGMHYARKIVDVFGDRTLEVIDESPAFLKEIKGLGKRRIERIRESWQQQKAVRNIMIFLQSHGIGAARAVRIYKTYGDKAVELVRANPYRLATDIWGVGFQTADKLAESMGIDRQSPLRAMAALRYVLQQLSLEGHVGFPEAGVIEKTVGLTKIGNEVVVRAVEDGRTQGELVRDEAGEEPWLYTKPLYQAETGVARGVRELLNGPHPLRVQKYEAALDWVERKMGLELASAQREAIRQAMKEKLLVVTGGPGVGKTTIVRGILEIFAAKDLKCLLAAPTGRAAKRLQETTGREARTIHRLLEFEPELGGFKRGQDLLLDFDLLVVDEASMVDISLMYALLRAVPRSACVVFVGDVDQLPSVGPGMVLADLIASAVVPVVRLTEIFRQAGQSWIIRAAHQVNHGEMPESAPPDSGDFYFIEAENPGVVLDRIVTLVRDRIPARFGLDPLKDIQVLTSMNVSELGTRNLNARLQEVLNPSSPKTNLPFRMGDKVLQTRNNYDKDVFNGDIGRVIKIDEQDQEMTIDYDGRPIDYDFGDLDELTLAYALTIHKSQGSEYPAVVIPVHTQHFIMLQRNLLYTGITRGKKLVVLVGTRKALAIAVGRHDPSRRHSGLARRLIESTIV